MPELLTTHDVAKAAGVTTVTVREWARSGKLKAMRLASGQRLFTYADLAQFLAERADHQDAVRHDAF